MTTTIAGNVLQDDSVLGRPNWYIGTRISVASPLNLDLRLGTQGARQTRYIRVKIYDAATNLVAVTPNSGAGPTLPIGPGGISGTGDTSCQFLSGGDDLLMNVTGVEKVNIKPSSTTYVTVEGYL